MNIKATNFDRIIYQLSVEDILTVIDEDNVHIELNEKSINFIQEQIGEIIDWRTAISIALSNLEEQKH